MKQWLLVLTVFVTPISCIFTAHFASFIDQTYGRDVRESLERRDLGLDDGSSFGGKNSDIDTIKKTPIVFIHGVTLKAVAFLNHRKFFAQKGYTSADLYATSYGDGGVTSAMDTPVDCASIKQIRNMLIAVHEYVKRKIDIIAWSMGSIIARKAILGGNCTETGEILGEPITHMIHTFLTVGGVNYGMQRCPKKRKSCNPINSMRCSSVLMKELNSQPKRYEGENSYAIYSNTDSIVGKMCCKKICGALKNACSSIHLPRLNHLTVFSSTLELQYKLLNDN